jgi:hypothetical protein
MRERRDPLYTRADPGRGGGTGSGGTGGAAARAAHGPEPAHRNAAADSRQTRPSEATTVERMRFVISAIPAERLDAMRRDGTDDAGERLEPFVAEEDGAPLRCCLRDARAGERLLLIAHRPGGTAGAYREIGPVFVHAGPCDGYAEPDSYPAGFRDRQQVLRAYDGAGRIVDAVLVDGVHAESGIARLLGRPGVATVHSRNVLYGCYMFAIGRG